MAKYPSIVLHGLLPYDELKVIRGRNVFLGCFVYRQGQEEVLEDWISAIGREASNEKYVLINLDEQPYSIRESMLSLGPLDARSEGWTETVAQKPTPYFWAYAPLSGGDFIYCLEDVEERLGSVRRTAVVHAELLRDAGFDA